MATRFHAVVTTQKRFTRVEQPPVASSLTPVFQLKIRPRHAEDAPIETLEVRARTMASARHSLRLTHPDYVVVSIAKL